MLSFIMFTVIKMSAGVSVVVPQECPRLELKTQSC